MNTTILPDIIDKESLFYSYHKYFKITIRKDLELSPDGFYEYISQEDKFSQEVNSKELESIINDFRKLDGVEIWPEYSINLTDFIFLDDDELMKFYNGDKSVVNKYKDMQNSILGVVGDIYDDIKGVNSIKGIIDENINRILDIEHSIIDLFPMLKTIEEQKNTEEKNKLNNLKDEDFFKEDKEEDEDHFISEMYDFIKEVIRLKTSLRSNHSNVLTKSLFLNLFSILDAFTGELLNHIYRKKTELLYNSNKQYNVKEILKAKSKDDLLIHIIEDEIDSIRRESYIKQFENMEKRFGIKLKEFDSWSNFVEISQRRNIIMHCDGKVTSQYISICKENNVKNIPEIGKTLKIDKEYLIYSIETIEEVIIKLGQTIWRKQFNDEIDIANKHIINFGFDMLILDKFKVAELISSYGLSIKSNQITCDSDRKLILINYCIALKHLNKNDEITKVLDKEDFSSCSSEFKLAKEILIDNFVEAIRLMKLVGCKGEYFDEKAYITWPLFHFFRKQPNFKIVFKEIYNKDFSEELEIGFRGLLK